MIQADETEDKGSKRQREEQGQSGQAGEEATERRTKTKTDEPKGCDLCLFSIDSPDPINKSSPLHWGHPLGAGRECYFCRRLHRQDVQHATFIV